MRKSSQKIVFTSFSSWRFACRHDKTAHTRKLCRDSSQKNLFYRLSQGRVIDKHLRLSATCQFCCVWNFRYFCRSRCSVAQCWVRRFRSWIFDWSNNVSHTGGGSGECTGLYNENNYPLYTALVIGFTRERFVALAYLRERTSELDIGAFLHCKDSKICFVGLAYGIVKTGV